MKNKIFSTEEKDGHKIYKFLFLKIKISRKERTPAVCIIEPGGIGDYMFCHPYFKYLKQSERFKNHIFIYIVKDIYKDMTLLYDAQCFDKIISYDTKKIKDEKYRKTFLKKINNYNIKTLINLKTLTPNSTDWAPRHDLVKNIKAKEKIVDLIKTSFTTDTLEQQLKAYNNPIQTKTTDKFELKRRKFFFENLTGVSISDETTEIKPIFDTNKKHIAISVAANNKARILPLEKWIKILNHLISKTGDDYELLFLGCKHDKGKLQELISQLDNPLKCVNLAGYLPVSLLPLILKQCEFLLAVETGTVHIACAVNCRAVCLSPGIYYNRFHPYKEGAEYIYPKRFTQMLENADEEFYEKYYFDVSSGEDSMINEIDAKDVTAALDKLLNTTETRMAVGGGGG